MKRIMLLLLLIMILLGLFTVHFSLVAVASESAEGDPTPPSGGGGGGGGGGSQVYYYYLPLVFTKEYPTSIYITSGFQTQILTEFLVNNTSILNLDPGKTLRIAPEQISNIKNGSLILSSAPLQVIVASENISQTEDLSFGYSVLPARMYGYRFVNTLPNALIQVYSLSPNNEISLIPSSLERVSQIYNVQDARSAYSFQAEIGDEIQTSRPSIVVSLTINSTRGSVATLLLPSFLKGKNFQGVPVAFSNNTDAEDISSLHLWSNTTNRVLIQYEDGFTTSLAMSNKTSYYIVPRNPVHGLITQITSEKDLTITWMPTAFFGGQIFGAATQLTALEEMNAAEFFAFPKLKFGGTFALFAREYPTSFLPVYATDTSYFLYSEPLNLTTPAIVSVSDESLNQTLIPLMRTPSSGVGYSASPTHVPPQASLAYSLFPLNSVSFNSSVTGFNSSWYRFADLVVAQITSKPADPEELSSLKIFVTVKNNGTLPVGSFQVQIYIDGKLKLETRIKFLEGLGEKVLLISRFESYGQHNVNVRVNIDILNEVSESSEENNQAFATIRVGTNPRVRVTAILLAVFISWRISKRLSKIFKLRKTREHAEADLVLGASEI